MILHKGKCNECKAIYQRVGYNDTLARRGDNPIKCPKGHGRRGKVRGTQNWPKRWTR